MSEITIPPPPNASLGAQDLHLDPLSYTIIDLKVFPSGAKLGPGTSPAVGNSYDLRGQTNTIIITEAIDQNAVHVNIGIKDAVGILDGLRLQGGEKIILHIRQKIKETMQGSEKKENVTKDIKLELYISDITSYEKVNFETQTFVIGCVTKPAYINQLSVLNEEFENTPGELIKKIAKEPLKISENIIGNFEGQVQSMKVFTSGAPSQTNNNGYGKPIKGIYPKLRPFTAINWLLRNANDAGTPVFFYESLLYGHRLVSWEELVRAWDPYEGEIYSNSPVQENLKNLTREDPGYYDTKKRIISVLKSSLGLSKYNDAKEGAYGSRLTAVDISTKEYKSKGNIFEYEEEEMVKLNDYKPFSTKPEFNDGPFHKNKNARNFFVSENKYAFNAKNYHSALELGDIQKKASYIANSDVLTHNIVLAGDPVLTAGSKIKLKLWQIQNFNEEDKLPDKQELGDQFMSGKFIVKQIQHIFKSEGYIMELVCIKDSSLVDLDEEYTP